MFIRKPRAFPGGSVAHSQPRRFNVRFKPQAVGDAGAIEGYGSVFKVLDDWGTVTMPGSFAASLERHKAAGTSPKMLWQHDQTQPIGAWSDVAEDDTGLRCAGNLILDVAKAVEAHALLKAGAIDGLSIGFQLISGEEVSAADAEAEGIDTSSGYRTEDGTIILMREIDVQEISLVTFQSCAEATVDGVRVKTIPAALKKDSRNRHVDLLALARAMTGRARSLSRLAKS